MLAPKWQLVAYLFVCYALNHADRQVVYTLFPALRRDFGFSGAALGLTASLFTWTYGLCSPLAGILGDRLSKVTIVPLSLAIWSLLTILAGFAPNGVSFLVCRAALGITEAFFFPAAYALLASAHGPETRSRAVAAFAASQLAGTALGGTLSGFIGEHLNWRASFWILGAAGLLFAWPLVRFLRTLTIETPPAVSLGGQPFARFLELLRIPTLRALAGCYGIGVFGLLLISTWLPTLLIERFGLGMAQAAFEASVYPQVGIALGLLAGGGLADWYSRRIHSARFWALVAVYLGFAPSMYLLGTAGHLATARYAGIAFGFFAGFQSANLIPAAFEVVPSSLWASTVGVVNFLAAGVSGLGPFTVGLGSRIVGIGRMITWMSSLNLVAVSVLIHTIVRNVDPDRARAEQRSSQPLD